MLSDCGRSAVAVTVLLGCLLAEPSHALAQAVETDSETPAIVITYDPMAPLAQAAIEAVKSYLTGMPARMLVEPMRLPSSSLSERLQLPGELAVARGAIGAFLIEIGPRGEILVFFTEPEGHSALVRRVHSGDFAVSREEAAIVVRSLLQALLDGKRIGMTEVNASAPGGKGAPEPGSRTAGRGSTPTPSEAEASAPAPDDWSSNAEDSAVLPSRPRVLTVSAGYVGTLFAPQIGWQSGLAVGLRWFPLPFGYVGASYLLLPTSVVETTDTTISLSRHPLELSLGYEGTTRLAWIGEVALVLDIVRRSTVRAGADFERTPPKDQASFAVGLRTGLSWGLLEWLRVTARLGADLAVTRPVYVSKRAAAQTVVEPSLFYPRVDVSLVAALP